MKYWAFVSYSHRDALAAAAIQRALETYRIPARLVGRATPTGEIPRTLSPLFRDREDLQAGADLTATVREALAASRYLLVVCSPDAARSAWVNREIVEFKKLHGESRVLAVIVAGEPFASRMPGREAEECFPEALRFALAADGVSPGEPREPIAADLRPDGDGKRLATLKLVAGMLGGAVGVDELGRRDAQRRARRMASVAVAAFAGMVVMTVMAVIAVKSREEARRQHAQAEDLLEFMLGDLRKKLDPVGRLDALDSVGEKALAYYASQDAERVDADSLGRRARAQHLIGEIREKQGKLDEALKAFEAASQTTEEALAQHPREPQRLFEHAQSVYWVGYVARRRGQLELAEAQFIKYQEFADRLLAMDGTNDKWRLETAYANQNLGVVLLERNRPAEALIAFAQARDAYALLMKQKPELAFELADANGWIARVLDLQGDYKGARAAQQSRLSVLETIPNVGANKKAQINAANARFELARLGLALGDLVAAKAEATRAVEEADEVVALDPANLTWLSEATINRIRLAESALALGELSLARVNIDRASRAVSRLMASDASQLRWHVNLRGYVLLWDSRLALAEGRNPPLDEVDGYLRDIRAIEASGKKLTRIQSEIVGTVELVQGDGKLRRGREVEARAHWAVAAGRIEPLARSGNYAAMAQFAFALLRMGKLDEAASMVGRLEASQFRHPALAGLQNELAHGAGTGRQIAREGIR